jgi:hypothetical protein
MHVYTQMIYREKYNLQKRRIFLFLSYTLSQVGCIKGTSTLPSHNQSLTLGISDKTSIPEFPSDLEPKN